jgi:hypothetical protein
MNAKKIQAVVDRMRMFFIAGRFDVVGRAMVEKWAKEIEEALKENP